MHIEGTIMATTTIKAVFHSNIQDVWNVVTSLKNYQWRSDLSKIEIINEIQFIEYTKNDFYNYHFNPIYMLEI